MYRAHESREDTIIFPEFTKLVSKEELHRFGEIFEDSEHEKFGKNGYKKILQKVIVIEENLGIHTLKHYTPTIKN